MLPESALVPESGPETPDEDGMLPRDIQRKTAYYDYAAEKSLSQADSKLFYQRSQLEAQKTGGSNWGASESSQYGSPILQPRMSNKFVPDSDGLHRSESVTSHKGNFQRFVVTSPELKIYICTYDIRYNKAAPPTGTAVDIGKHPESNVVQEPGLASGTYPNSPGGIHRTESLLRADLAAREHLAHPEIPHEHKPALAVEGLHGAGAGVGVGSGVGGFADNDSQITSELSTIYTNIQKILDLRHKYMRLSLQNDNDNPKDDSNWSIYPPPPEPAWYEEGYQAPLNPSGKDTQGNSLSNSAVLERPRTTEKGSADVLKNLNRVNTTLDQSPQSPQTSKAPKPKRKPGFDIGEDFDIDDLLPVPGPGEMAYKLDGNSVYQVYENSDAEEADSPVINIPTIREFYMDLEEVLNVSSDGPTKSFAFRRLQYLEGKFNLYVLLNEYQEMADSKRVPHRDFYNVRKVDTHVHHSACMNQKHLLRFIKSKMKKFPNEVVMYRDGKYLTLEEVFQSINLTAYDLSIDTLDMHVSNLVLKEVEHELITVCRLIQTLSTVLISSTSSTIQSESLALGPFS